ncbi:hypothetical protein HPP92_000624 [Vanilla planifolia]|uniref:Uncharacterized protein n=1 Tax=Vanilla planifolia TaxID=51239 RepID=A0A835VCT6_VANPL|nr:hypothetical protein HPP92_000645 [Vanilla planifolia]KAG0496010.1 hypothetical protein HPP92_000701 [Vanilla planifolia]KAG0500552.1 hypothetical protein HPP92_000624 [Vanilla planifolia]
MASNQARNIALGTAFFGVLAFIFGVVAENKKPAHGTPVTTIGYVLCKFPNDPTVALGSLSVVALVLSTALGLLSVFYPYKGKSVPRSALFHGMTLRVFFLIATLVSVFAEAMMMWATITEGLHQTNNKHKDLNYACPTAKTGLFGGAAFLALDASLFWLVCQMLTLNARADYLDDDDPKGTYGEVLTTNYEASRSANP